MKIFRNVKGKGGKTIAEINIDFSGTEERMKKAQRYLDNRVLTDCTVYVPIRNGVLRASGTYSTIPGSGEVKWNTPYAHYMYEGRTMVGVESKKAFANKDEPKEYDGNIMTYSEPNASAKWFEVAKANNLQSWEKGVQKILNG